MAFFGEGWSVSIPYIEQENRHGVDQLYSPTTSPVFVAADNNNESVHTAKESNVAYQTFLQGLFSTYTFMTYLVNRFIK